MPDRKKKDGASTTLELVFGAALLVLWCAGSIQSFKAEALALKVIPEALRLTYDEKKSLMDGHVYDLAKEASSVIPPGSKVYLFTPAAAENASYYFLKLRYYLYPRKVMDGGSTELRQKELLECDYLVVYIPKTDAYGSIADFELLPYLEKVYDRAGADGHEAFYKVKRGPGA